MKKLFAVVVLIVLVLAATALLGWLEPDAGGRESVDVRAEQVSASMAGRREPSAPASPGVAGADKPRGALAHDPERSRDPLPPLDQPITDDYITEMKRRAEAGDRRAACRLGFDLEECRLLQRAMDAERNLLEWAAESPPGSREEEWHLEGMVALQELTARAAKVCQAVTRQQVNEAWRYLLRAARQGSVAAASRFAGLPPFDRSDILRQLEAFDAYRAHAADLLEFAAWRGDQSALFVLFRAHLGWDPLPGLPEAFARDEERAALVGLILLHVLDGNSLSDVRDTLSELRGFVSPDRWIDLERSANDFVLERMAGVGTFDAAEGIYNGLDAGDCADEP